LRGIESDGSLSENLFLVAHFENNAINPQGEVRNYYYCCGIAVRSDCYKLYLANYFIESERAASRVVVMVGRA
jgi:hypothetical protein